MKKWFTITAKGETAAEINIFDEIGFWGVTAQSFINDLKNLGDKVTDLTVFINSPGGSVFDGLAIYNSLRQHPANITVKVMGVAASAASFIAMAGDKIVMPENTFLMVHNPMGGVFGNADEMRDWADTLDKIAASLIGIYVSRTGKSEDEIKALLDAETWMTAKEALDMGFADEVEAEMKIAASFDMEHAPEAVRNAFKSEPPKQPEPEQKPTATLAEQIKALAESSDMKDFADLFALNCESLDAAQSRIGEAREIMSLCAVAKSDKGGEYVRGNKSLADVRAALVNERVDDREVDTAQRTNPPSASTTTQPNDVKVADIWAKRRKQFSN